MTTSFLYGIHTLEMLFAKQPERIVRLYMQVQRDEQTIQLFKQLAKQHAIPLELVSREKLDHLTQRASHQGVVAQCAMAKSLNEAALQVILSELVAPAFFLILDNIQDPHNLGACLRSAEATGVHAVLAPKDKSVGLTSTVSKVACGAAEIVPFIQVTNLARTLRDLKEHNIWIFGAAGEAKKSLYQADFTLSTAIVLGAEGAGLRRLTREHCDELLHIPMYGAVSSLNVAVAAAVFLFEAVRQRGIDAASP
ncbi:MAG: 23S rRNA (guanosine(2251)-2'-O)-methyltransferase RlmB [Gammaproteobacteria bacterium RIFCSPHIGHO2_12_FULL_41_20]|nr:MAG: 23S rRNA (guanosine(2251)-2'-O)-methyltransferase RlmB [Gammaproteobacteria bacterium RIFCSPHIGHO2_12_FULL_41_20]